MANFYYPATQQLMTANTSKFYLELADTLIAKADKVEVAETARLLALNLAHYRRLHGEIPFDETMALLDDGTQQEQIQLVSDGMEILIGVLGNIVSGVDEIKH